MARLRLRRPRGRRSSLFTYLILGVGGYLVYKNWAKIKGMVGGIFGPKPPVTP